MACLTIFLYCISGILINRSFGEGFDILGVTNTTQIYVLEETKQFCDRSLTILKKNAVRIQDIYWNLRGEQEIVRKEATASFNSSTSEGGHLIRWMNKHESVFLDELLKELESDDVFWDVGANLGLFTCLAMDKVRDGSIYAFEPYPPNAAQLRENIRLNSGPAEVLEMALSERDGTQDLFHPDTEEVGYQRSSLGDNLHSESFTVKTRSGDSLVSDGKVPIPNIVKIDVEGAEYAVAAGLENTLADAACRCVLCEVHLPNDGRPSIEDFGASVDELTSLLRTAGFDIDKQRDRGDALLLKATK